MLSSSIFIVIIELELKFKILNDNQKVKTYKSTVKSPKTYTGNLTFYCQKLSDYIISCYNAIYDAWNDNLEKSALENLRNKLSFKIEFTAEGKLNLREI